MGTTMQTEFSNAIDNITRLGDTDVFPLPVENHLLFDKRAEAIQLLETIHRNLKEWINNYPPVSENMLAPVGYTGFRWATQIDPIWNAYFLALVISVGEQIETARLPVNKETVFSYRFRWDDTEKTVFDKSLGWADFQRQSIARAKQCKYVLTCDISDFYPRIYHHRLENALKIATNNSDACWRIMELLKSFSKNVSYGLPVGGPAARLLSELLLNRMDRLLLSNGITFCRFADDYHVFANTEEEAYQHLLYFSQKLLENEGLLLQKAKTRVMSSDEFLANSEFSLDSESDTEQEQQTRNFLRFRLHFDPYSQTAVEDYESLKAQLSQFDVVGMLSREMRKSRVHQALSRKLISALKHLDAPQRDSAIASLLENMPVLYPVLPAVLLLTKGVVHELSEATREKTFKVVRDLLRAHSHIVSVPAHLAYAVRLLAYDTSEEANEILSRVYSEASSSAIRRDVIYVMARRRADFWISDILKSFHSATEWERRALIVASYILGDEGKHWRDAHKNSFSEVQALVRQWASDKNSGTSWEIPI